MQNVLAVAKTYKELLAFLGGMTLIVLASIFFNPFTQKAPYSEEVHVHSDFLLYVLDERIDLRDNQYQSYTGHVLHENFHFHDNVDTVIHRHAEDLTLATFLDSLGITLSDTCLTFSETSYCTNEQSELMLYVNSEIRENITGYVPQDEDRILLYYGDPNSPNITRYVGTVTDEACIYSGTCPERGTPPPESCGITCEL